ncbi:MAG: D-alanyl-D-alanine carboxypeptidase family protein [Pseudomonadota bacterium]
MRGFCRSVCVAVLAAAFVLATPAHANPKYAAFVVHADSGDVLFDRYSTARRYPASLTKMMTLYLLFEALEAGELSLDSKMKVSRTAAGQPPSKLGVAAGSTIDVDTAIQALVIKSANDVAVVVAEQLAGSEWRFAQKMSAKARALGMRSTTFRNASGLPNRRQVTNARDMAVLGQRVLQDFPQFFHYFSAQSFTYNGRTYATHNRLMKSFDGVNGIKTGYTRASGFNLVTSAEKDGQRLIGVVLGGRKSWSRDRHMRDIIETAFADIAKNPQRLAALHRNKPSPRLKPTLAIERQGPLIASATVAGDEALRQEIASAALSLSDGDKDALGALIAAADSDDFNAFQRARLASVPSPDGFIGEGDLEPVDGFSWDVQIGAYSTKSLAQSELEAAALKGGLAERDRAILPTVRADGSILYRARFRRLSEIEATLACTGLKQAGMNCFAISDAETRMQ